MTDYEKLPYLKPSDYVDSEFFFVRAGRGKTNFGVKTFVDVANKPGVPATATLPFKKNKFRDEAIDELKPGDRFTLEAIDTGKPKAFVKVVKL